MPSTGFTSYWRARAEAALAPRGVAWEEAPVSCPQAGFWRLSFASLDGQEAHARVILPSSEGPHPCILVFADMDRGPRGWFHLLRYAGAGLAVAHLEARPHVRDLTCGWEDGPASLAFARHYDDALALAGVAAGLPGVDASRMVAFGEGAGGALAVAAAALVPGVVKACALNPMPCAPRLAWEAGAHELAYEGLSRHFRDEDPTAERADDLWRALEFVDACSFAALLGAQEELLLGTCLMDTAAPPASQRALFDAAACDKRLVEYPKFAHERLNDFENRLFDFMHFGERGACPPPSD